MRRIENEGKPGEKVREWVHSGERRSENKKDLRVTQEARRQPESLDFQDSSVLPTTPSSRRHHRCRHLCASLSQLVLKVVSYLFMNYATRPAGSKADALHVTYQWRNFLSATTRIRCYPGLGAGRINGSIDPRSHARDTQLMRNFLSAIVIGRNDIAPAAAQIYIVDLIKY